MLTAQILLRQLAATILFLCMPVSVLAEDAVKEATIESAYGKYVDEVGNVTLPEDFATQWAHLGTWAVVEDNVVPDMHSVYAPRDVVAYYRKHREFPDGAMLVKELRHSKGAEHTTGRSFWATEEVIVWFAMVKDTKNRFPDNPIWGDGWGWALFDGADRDTQIGTDYETDCLGCHVPAEEQDWLYVYAYPVLGDSVSQFAPTEFLGADD